MAGYRVFATCDIGSKALNRLRKRGYQLEVYPRPDAPPKALILEKVASGVDGLITTLRDPIDEEVFRAGEGTLKVVAQDAVGFDNIDRQAANHYRIPFTNTPDVLTAATAEFAVFMLGCLSRKLYPSETLVRTHQWETWHPSRPFLGDEVAGKSVAIIGAGRIGKAFAAKCVSLDVDILCHSRSGAGDAFLHGLQQIMDLQYQQGFSSARRQIRELPFRQALGEADYISLHVPLTPQTHHLMDETAFAQMKPTAYLINTSRGPVIDEMALYRALKEGVIGGAALDVFEVEPLPEASPLRDESLVERLRLFHHFGSGGIRTRLSPDPQQGMAGRTVQGLIEVLEAGSEVDFSLLSCVVNKEAFRPKN